MNKNTRQKEIGKKYNELKAKGYSESKIRWLMREEISKYKENNKES